MVMGRVLDVMMMNWKLARVGSSNKTFFISSQISSKISLQLFLRKLPWNMKFPNISKQLLNCVSFQFFACARYMNTISNKISRC